MKDLFVLVADGNMRETLLGLLSRLHQTENTKRFSFDVESHPNKDPGVYRESESFLRPFQNKYHYVLVIMDREGSGVNSSREEMELHLEQNLNNKGWQNRCCAIVIDPELENWIWVRQNKMEEILCWNDSLRLYDWARSQGEFHPGFSKPIRPKEVFEAALRFAGIPRSSSLYRKIAKEASYRECQDPAFLKMLGCLKSWFRN